MGGVQGKYIKQINTEWTQSYTLEILNIRHPKEIRVPSYLTTASFILGKSNYLFSIRPQYSIERLLFKKDPIEGVQVNLVAAAGPSLGIIKPYIVEYQEADGDLVFVQYSEIINKPSIVGGGGWFRGFGQSSFVPGVNAKMSLLFEYSTQKTRISALEAGFAAEQFASSITLNPSVSSESFFITAFVTLSFGGKL